MDESTIPPVPAAELSLAADVRSAGAARRFVTATLTTWGKTTYGDNAVLLVSELVTNAALHAKTEIVVRIELMPECLLVSVTDGSPRQPVVRHYSDQATTGRGLALVNALSLRWGIKPHPDGSKTVWAEIDDDGGRRHEESTRDASVASDREQRNPGRPGSSGGTAAILSAA